MLPEGMWRTVEVDNLGVKEVRKDVDYDVDHIDYMNDQKIGLTNRHSDIESHNGQ
jgi:hypothetical protein